MTEPATASARNLKDEAFLKRLKADTAPQHAALEAHPLLQALMMPTVSRKQYFRYLSRMQKIVEAYEAAVLPLLAGSPLAFAATKSSAQLIAEDLYTLSFAGEQAVSLSAFVLPQNLSLSFAWGFAYVVEGAKLGGRVIFKHLQKIIGLTASEGGAYLANAGANTGAEWKEFLQKLSAYTAAHRCEDAVLNGAIFGFTCVRNYFEANEHEE